MILRVHSNLVHRIIFKMRDLSLYFIGMNLKMGPVLSLNISGTTLSYTVKNRNSLFSQKKCLSYIDIGSWMKPGCALCFDQGVKLSGKIPLVTLKQLFEELPSAKAKIKYSNVVR